MLKDGRMWWDKGMMEVKEEWQNVMGERRSFEIMFSAASLST